MVICLACLKTEQYILNLSIYLSTQNIRDLQNYIKIANNFLLFFYISREKYIRSICFAYYENTLDCKDNRNCNTDIVGLNIVNVFFRHILCPEYIWYCNPVIFE